MNKISILVTGAEGQLGSEIRDAAWSSNHNYIFTDISSLDILNRDALRSLFRLNNIQVVVNCAGYTNVDKAESEPDVADMMNHRAVRSIAEVCAEMDVVLIHISTDYVFDGKSDKPYTENDTPNPLNVYGKTKLAGENAVIESGCKYIIFRTSWLYSPYGNNFVKTIYDLSAKRDRIEVVDDQRGNPTYADTLADVICNIIENQTYNNQLGLYHYSGKGDCTWYEFARKIVSLTGHRCEVVPASTESLKRAATRPSYSVLDKSKFTARFGFEIPAWEKSLADCIELLEEIQNEK